LWISHKIILKLISVTFVTSTVSQYYVRPSKSVNFSSWFLILFCRRKVHIWLQIFDSANLSCCCPYIHSTNFFIFSYHLAILKAKVSDNVFCLTKTTSLVSCPGQNKRIAPLSFFHGCQATKGLIALTPEVNCDQTAMGFPPSTSAVFLIAK
jgi:hypothetical protein